MLIYPCKSKSCFQFNFVNNYKRKKKSRRLMEIDLLFDEHNRNKLLIFIINDGQFFLIVVRMGGCVNQPIR